MPAASRGSLLSYSPADLERLFVELGGQAFHARIARRELLANGVLSYGCMSGLAKKLVATLEQELPLLTGEEISRTRSRDGTTKLLIEFPSDGASSSQPVTVETVHIPRRSGPGSSGATLCVSTQAGCPVGCPFCASGLGGLSRNLTSAEILEQYARGRSLSPLRRSVVMGIGEPLLNFENLSAALAVVRSEVGLGARKTTVSTVGFPNRLLQAAASSPQFQLAISLHTPDDKQRDELVPAMAGVPIAEILDAGDEWFRLTGREVTYEYVLLGGANDSAGHARRLAERLQGRRATVNLIPYNPTDSLPFQRPGPDSVEGFCQALCDAGIVATVRWSRGLEGAAACGQLRWSRSENHKDRRGQPS